MARYDPSSTTSPICPESYYVQFEGPGTYLNQSYTIRDRPFNTKEGAMGFYFLRTKILSAFIAIFEGSRNVFLFLY